MSLLKICWVIFAAFTFALFQPALAQDIATKQNEQQYSPKVSHAIFIVKASNKWLKHYAKLEPKKQKLFRRAAISVAKFRRAALKLLIQRSPEDAFQLSLSPGQRQGLPNFVTRHLETRINTTGDIVLRITEALPQGPQDTPNDGIDSLQDSINPPNLLDNVTPDPVTSWRVRIGQASYQAFVYGNRLRHQTKFDTPIHGIALNDFIAVSESPLYLYDAFEKVQLGFKPDQIVATSGGLPIPLPDFEAFEGLEQELLKDILRFGPLPMPFNPNEWTTGIKNLLVMKVMYRGDDREPPYSDADIGAWVGGANSFFIENSQRLTSFNTTVISAPFPVLSADTYTASSPDVAHAILEDNALRTAAAFGVDLNAYDRIVILAPQLFDRPYAMAEISGETVTVTGETPDLRVTLAHELGHTYGFAHSGYQDLTSVNPIVPIGPHVEYGDAWDIMGTADLASTAGNPQRRHFNAFFKSLAGWLPDTAVSDGTLGGDFRLRAHDAVVPVGTRAIFIEAGDGSTYWLGRRSLFPGNRSMMNGIEVRRVDNYPSAGYGPVALLDLDLVFSGSDRREFHSLTSQTEDATNNITVRIVIVAEDHLGEFARVFITR